MRMERAAAGYPFLVTLLLAACAAATAPRDASRDGYHWFAVPVEVSALPPDARFVPLTCHVDFSALVKQLGATGVVDQNSLRLVRIAGDGSEAERPVQFTSDPQPRPGQPARLPDTPTGVSYLGEYEAGVTPDGPKVAGELAWVAQGDAKGTARYRLEFGIRRDGHVVQVPYPPQDLKVFDADGRAGPTRHFARMQVRPDRPMDGRVDFFDGSAPVTTYHLGPASAQESAGNPLVRRPFMFPVFGPDGDALTNFGKPHDPTGSHAHHYSLWVAHADVAGVDFWGEQGGAIVSSGEPEIETGPVFCRVTHGTRWVRAARELLHERRRLTLHRTPEAFRAMDVELEMKPAGDADVTLGKTTFGFLAARVARSMSVFDGGGEILTARGGRNERGAHLTRAEWLDQSGPVAEGRWAGVALLDHPSNPNHPTLWHCRNDGWAGAAFAGEAPYTIEPGQPLRLRYRVILHRGDAEEGEIARRFAEFAAKPVVRIGIASELAE